MFRQLDYQDRVLTTLETYLDLLKDKKVRSDKIAKLAADEPDLGLPIPNFSKEAWAALKNEGKLPMSRAAIPFSARLDGCDRPVPNTVLKVPTGGGKTWLASSAVSRIMGRYLDRNTGFILWIVPNEAIYTQTLKHMKDQPTFLPAGARPCRRRSCADYGEGRPPGRPRRGNPPLRHAPDAAIGESGNPGLTEDV